MQRFFTSDLHISHRAITKYRPDFLSPSHHDEFMIDSICKLPKRSLLFILGDFLFDSPDFDYKLNAILQCKCNIKLLLGNHCSTKLYSVSHPRLEVQLPLFSYKNLWLSHAPIHPNELRNRFGNVHGHLHLETLSDPRYFNVNIDVNDYQFVPFERIQSHYKGRLIEPNP